MLHMTWFTDTEEHLYVRWSAQENVELSSEISYAVQIVEQDEIRLPAINFPAVMMKSGLSEYQKIDRARFN